MCGIFFALNKTKCNNDEIDFDLLKKRGPDSFKTLSLEVGNDLSVLFASSVLSLRGGNNESDVTSQPLKDDKSGNILLWNGELFASDLIQVNSDENDGLNILRKLSENFEDKTEKDILEIFETIKGPYAFIFYLKKQNCLYFGRDRFGRRSLLISASDNSLMVSSIQLKLKFETNFQDNFNELKANKIYKLDLNQEPNCLEILEWKKIRESELILPLESLENSFANITCKPSTSFLNDSISSFNESTDLTINENELEKISHKFYDLLKESTMRRVRNLPKLCKACNYQKGHKLTSERCSHAKVAVLFSGGVDSTVLAAMADLCIPQHEEIDLLNIAFENQKKNNNQEKIDDFLVPDRVSGLKSLSELNPKRKWNFVEINIKVEELRKERDDLIKHLLFPHQTVLDDSIGCALWFASRGKGLLKNSNSETIEFTSNAEILLLGMGADEQLAGYARHRTRFEKYGMESLVAEVKMEMKRISERNLGRDDRILSDHGKESRLPFLDEDLISFLNETEMKYKCDMSLPRGQGEKVLLRKLAADRFNLKFSASLQKRAIQFGSRVAKIENCKEKASDVCNRLAKNVKIED